MSRATILRAAVLALLVPGLSVPVLAANPDFAGTWKLDPDRSEAIGQFPVIEGTYEIALQGEDLKVARTGYRDGQARTVDWVVITDGKPHDLPGLVGRPRSVRAKWKKDKLTQSYSITRGQTDIDITETWTINKDGELEIRYSTRMAQQAQARTEYYVRVDP